jgi:hypothetical protein
MHKLLTLLFLISASFLKGQTYNQNTCQDSTLIVFDSCNEPDYNPVCGCDGVTYRTECFARNQGLLSFTQGSCEFMDFDLVPNKVSNIGELKIKVVCKDIADINVWIFDMFFHQMYYQVSRQFPDVELYPDIRNFGNGMFFVVVEAAGTVKVKRLLVNQIQP